MQTRLDLRLSEPGRYMNSVLEKKRGGKNCTFTDTYCRLMKKCYPMLSQPTDCSKHISAKAILLPLTIYKPHAREQICVETFSITNVIFSCRWKKICQIFIWQVKTGLCEICPCSQIVKENLSKTCGKLVLVSFACALFGAFIAPQNQVN